MTLRHALCGCTWLIGSTDHQCQDDDCRCADHHPPQCTTAHWTGMRCLREQGHDQAHMGLITDDLYATWTTKETTE